VDLTDIVQASITLHREIKSAIKKCNDIAEICTSQKLLYSLAHELEKVTQYYDHIRELMGETRVKRAPLEFIGQISKILFGTLTTEDAHHITTAIEHVENKTNDLAALLINQTIAARARFGELYNATLEIRDQQTQLYKYIQNKISNLSKEIAKNDVYGYFEDIIQSIDRAILEHEIDLNILIDGILFGKQGLIHPRIISPASLIKNSKFIKEQVPHAEFPVAINEGRIDQLIKISKLHIAYIDRRLIYSLNIPLLTPGRYKLYKPLPLPAKQEFDHKKFAIIQADVEYVALNEDADNFYEFQEGELKECISLDDTFICPAKFPLKKIRQTPTCNIELLLNHNINIHDCKIIIRELKDTYWKALTTPGNWIYSTPRKEEIRIQCPNYDKPFDIENSGIITIQKGCKIRATTAVMNNPSVQVTKILQHYAPHNNLSIFNLYKPTQKKYEINLAEATRELWISNNSNIEATFEDIIQKARQIKERKFREQWITAYSATGCAVGILGTLMVIIFLAYQNSWIQSTTNYIYHECCHKGRKKETEDKGTTPYPTQEYKNAKIETPDKQSVLTSHNEHQEDSITIAISPDTPVTKEDKS